MQYRIPEKMAWGLFKGEQKIVLGPGMHEVKDYLVLHKVVSTEPYMNTFYFSDANLYPKEKVTVTCLIRVRMQIKEPEKYIFCEQKIEGDNDESKPAVNGELFVEETLIAAARKTFKTLSYEHLRATYPAFTDVYNDSLFVNAVKQCRSIGVIISHLEIAVIDVNKKVEIEEDEE